MASVSCLRSGFDSIPAEVLDIITGKLQQDYPVSMREVEKTNRALRDSARRLTKTLVVTPSKAIERQTLFEASLGSKHPNELLAEELKQRPGLSTLVIEEPNFLKRGSRLSFEQALRSVSWVKCTAIGHQAVSPRVRLRADQPVAWHSSCCKRVLSTLAQASLQELSIVSFEYLGTKITQGLPNLVSLKLGGYGCGSFVEHENLVSLDMSALWHRRHLPKQANLRRSASRPSSLGKLWLPNVQHVTGAACCYTLVAGTIFLAGSLGDCPRLPRSTRTLELVWIWEYPAFIRRGCSLNDLLAKRTCPLLRKIRVSGTSDGTSSRLSAHQISRWFCATVKKAFGVCPQLELFEFTHCTGEHIVEWKRTVQGIEVCNCEP